MPDWAAAAEEPERRQLLEVDADATSASATSWRATRSGRASRSPRDGGCTARSSTALLAADADPADIVHHAEAAGAEDVVADYALVAARRAAALESNREAYSHYLRASDFVDRLPPRRAGDRARGAGHGRLRRRPARGRVRRRSSARSRSTTTLGDEAARRPLHAGPVALPLVRGRRRAARGPRRVEAIAILEPLGESVELARAYSGLSQLAMLAEDAETALVVGRAGARARDPARRRAARARTRSSTSARARLQLDPRDTATLLEAHAHRATPPGDRHEATRALVNLGYTLMCWAQPEPAARVRSSRRSPTREEHEVHTLRLVHRRRLLAWLRLRAGEWDEAERIARARARARRERVASCSRGRCWPSSRSGGAIRTPAERLADLAAQADRAGELQRIAAGARARDRVGADARRADADRAHRAARRRGPPARPAPRLGRAPDRGLGGGRRDRRRARPARRRRRTRRWLRRDWRAAADAFGDVGWAYDRALMLSLLDDEEALVEAIEIARGLGAGAADAARRRAHARARAPRARRGRARRRARTRPG